MAKTLYLLNYLNDEVYRRRILTQLNRGESRHAVARAIFHGQRGELRQRYREGQEDQLGALGLVVNAVVLWSMPCDVIMPTTSQAGPAVTPPQFSHHHLPPHSEPWLPTIQRSSGSRLCNSGRAGRRSTSLNRDRANPL